MFTCAAKSTLILENDVRCTCSYFNFGSSERPVAFPMSPSYRSLSCFQVMFLPLHYQNKLIMQCTCTFYGSAILLTHIDRHLDAQQFRTVFIRCGGSEKKNKSRGQSFACTFLTLYVRGAELLCNLTIRRLLEAPSKVAAITFV